MSLRTPIPPKGWARVNRNSLAQFMRTRLRYVFVSKPLVLIPHPIAGAQLAVSGQRGQTYRRPKR